SADLCSSISTSSRSCSRPRAWPRSSRAFSCSSSWRFSSSNCSIDDGQPFQKSIVTDIIPGKPPPCQAQLLCRCAGNIRPEKQPLLGAADLILPAVPPNFLKPRGRLPPQRRKRCNLCLEWLFPPA